MELIIRLTQQTGLAIAIMACATGLAIGAIGLVELAGRIRSWKGLLKDRR